MLERSCPVSAALAVLAAVLAAGCADHTPAGALPGEGFPPVPACSGDNDGVVDPGELDFTPGRVAPYAVQAEGQPPVEDRGDAASGAGSWDFSATGFDRLEQVPLLDPRRQWYAEQLPTASLALLLSGGDPAAAEPSPPPSHLLLHAEPTALSIVGVASVEPERLLLIYAKPVPLMRFPLALGQRWLATTGFAAGSVLEGIPLAAALEDGYTLAVDGRGTMRLPGMWIEQVLRLSVRLERRLQGRTVWQSTETYLMHECLGTVAHRNGPADPWWVVWYPM
ncbi:MAG: hypothetical protein FJ125_11365 [Deltaproteobacteria bacterium]|nr:hypothetical protein [Deltaproteobacteria bacterium]